MKGCLSLFEDGCNYGHIDIAPRTTGFTQMCAFSMIKPDESMVVYKDCEDPWCFAVLAAVRFSPN